MQSSLQPVAEIVNEYESHMPKDPVLWTMSVSQLYLFAKSVLGEGLGDGGEIFWGECKSG